MSKEMIYEAWLATDDARLVISHGDPKDPSQHVLVIIANADGISMEFYQDGELVNTKTTKYAELMDQTDEWQSDV